MQHTLDQLTKANGTSVVFPTDFSSTAHPLGGAVMNEGWDEYGEVYGHKNLFVMDGALIPGSTGAVNSSLTIAALAERSMEHILDDIGRGNSGRPGRGY